MVCPTNCLKTIRVKANLLKTSTMTVTVLLTFQKLELESTTVRATWAQTHLTLIPTMTAFVTAPMRCHQCALLVLTPTLLEPAHSVQLFW